MDETPPRKSLWQKIQRRDDRLVFKSRATEGSDQELAALVDQEFVKRTASDRHDAYQRLKTVAETEASLKKGYKKLLTGNDLEPETEAEKEADAFSLSV